MSEPNPTAAKAPVALLPGEEIIWSGAPSQKFFMGGTLKSQAKTAANVATFLWIVAGLVYIVQFEQNVYWPGSAPLGIFVAGILVCGTLPTAISFVSRRSWRYVLTNKRIVILRNRAFGRSVRSIPLLPYMPVQLTDDPWPAVRVFANATQEERGIPLVTLQASDDPIGLMGQVFGAILRIEPEQELQTES